MCWTLIQSATLVVIRAGLLHRVLPWLLCVLNFYTEYHLGCYVCWTFIQSTTLVVICSRLLSRVLLWLLFELDFYTEYKLGCYVYYTFIQSTTLVVLIWLFIQSTTSVAMCAGISWRVTSWIVKCTRLLSRVSLWLLYVLDFNTECHLGCYMSCMELYVCRTLIQNTAFAAMWAGIL